MITVTISDASSQLSELVERAYSEREIIILCSERQPKAVLLSLEAFDELVGMREHRVRDIMPADSFQQQFKEALKEAGCDSHDKILNLVREVKQEMAAERARKSTASESKAEREQGG